MMTADTGLTKPLGAVMATRPGRIPLAVIVGSGLPFDQHMYSIALSDAAAPASIVLTAMRPMRRAPLPEAARVLPGLKPNQPNARIKQPRMATVMLWPGMKFGEPSLLYLPVRAPSTIAPASAIHPPTEGTTPDPAKSAEPSPKPKFDPSCPT